MFSVINVCCRYRDISYSNIRVCRRLMEYFHIFRLYLEIYSTKITCECVCSILRAVCIYNWVFYVWVTLLQTKQTESTRKFDSWYSIAIKFEFGRLSFFTSGFCYLIRLCCGIVRFNIPVLAQILFFISYYQIYGRIACGIFIWSLLW